MPKHRLKVLGAVTFAWLIALPLCAQGNGSIVRPDNREHYTGLRNGVTCATIDFFSPQEHEMVMAAFRDMETNGELRLGSRASVRTRDKAYFDGRGGNMVRGMAEHEVAGILLAAVVYRDCISRRLVTPSLLIEVEAGGRLLFRQDARGRIRSFR